MGAAIFSRNRRSTPQAENGFDISFTDKTVYDLDELVRAKDRGNADSELMIKVINDKEVGDRILSELMAALSTSVSQVVSNADVQKGVSEIIRNVAARYGLTSMEHTPENVYAILNKEVNEYLKGLFDAYGVSYDVRFFDATRVDVSYTFDPLSMRQLTQERLNQYLTEYKGELASVKEGSLAITNTGKRRTVGRDDYKTYLLGEEFGQEKSTDAYRPTLTGRRPIVVWEEGSQDNSENGEDAIDIYSTLENLEAIVKNHSELLRGDGDTILGKFNVVERTIGPLNINANNDVSTNPRYACINETVMLLGE